jgi:hypothetical protein
VKYGLSIILVVAVLVGASALHSTQERGIPLLRAPEGPLKERVLDLNPISLSDRNAVFSRLGIPNMLDRQIRKHFTMLYLCGVDRFRNLSQDWEPNPDLLKEMLSGSWLGMKGSI